MQLFTPPEILSHFGLGTFVCLDFETTGLKPGEAEIIEMAAVRVEEGQIANQFHSLVSIHGELPEFITNLTGITENDLEGQPELEAVMPDLLEHIGSAPIVAHNLRFDLSFLEEALHRSQQFDALGRLQLHSDRHWDILLLARMLFPILPSHALGALTEFFNIPVESHHRALDDVLAEIQVFDRLLLRSLEVKNEVLALWYQIVKDRRTFYTRFCERLHYLRSHDVHLLSQKQLPKFDYSIPTRSNVLGQKQSDEETGEAIFDAEGVTAIFKENGILAETLPEYETRMEQIEMARAVCQAFEQEEFLLVEAGTGTGKSWAYLIPAIFWAQAHDRDNGRTIVSTNTKNLQDQIFYKDLPYLYENLPVNFQAVLLKGRNNYLCFNRWYQFLQQLDFTEESGTIENVLPLVQWLHQTRTGDIEELGWFNPGRSMRIWWHVRSDGNFCTSDSCQFKKECFVNRVRFAAKEADVVVVNHALLMSDLLNDYAILSHYNNLILDEAHNLEAVATQFLGDNWNFWSLQQLVSDVSDSGDVGRMLKSFIRFLKSNLKKREEIVKTIEQNFISVQQNGDELAGLNRLFFDRVLLEIQDKLSSGSLYPTKIRYKDWSSDFPNLVSYADELMDLLQRFVDELERLTRNLEELLSVELAEEESIHNITSRIVGFHRSVREVQEAVTRLLLKNSSTYVYWLETSGKEQNVTFRSAPVEVGSLLYENLFSKLKTVIFTSATLSVAGDFSFFVNRLGLDLVPPERLATRLLGSPFDYRDQMLLMIPDFMPNPNYSEYSERSAELLKVILQSLDRATLVLFTSYRMLDDVFQRLRDELRDQSIPVVAQGQSGPRNHLLGMMKQRKARALLGTYSFWEGIDLPGQELELLFIIKLPFEVPSDPVVQARLEAVEKRGQNSFYHYSLPMAILRLRQGLGRLIRSRDDRGVAVLADSRLVKTQYGARMIESMPVEPLIFSSVEDLKQSLLKWFEK